MVLYLQKKISDSDSERFMVNNTLEINRFYGVSYKLTLFATTSRNTTSGEEVIFYPPYSATLMNNGIDIEEALDFIKRYPEDIDMFKDYIDGSIVTTYYIVYDRKFPEINRDSYCIFNERKAVIELTFQEDGYIGVYNLYINMLPYASVLYSIRNMFDLIRDQVAAKEPSKEVAEVFWFINFITKDDSLINYEIELYNDRGYAKTFKYHKIDDIYDRITCVRYVTQGGKQNE